MSTAVAIVTATGLVIQIATEAPDIIEKWQKLLRQDFGDNAVVVQANAETIRINDETIQSIQAFRREHGGEA